MSLNSLFFVFLFLPAGWLIQRLAPEKAKNAVLLLLSAAFITWGSPRDMLLILCSALFNFFTALELSALQQKERKKYARLVFISGIAVNLLLLFFYKYTGFALSAFGVGKSLSLPVAPVGISFYTFSAVSFLTDVYRGTVPAPKNFIDLALYLTFFPKFISGPIVPYADFEKELYARSADAALTEAGVTRFTVGLAKKLVVADSLALTFNAIIALPAGDLTVIHAWLGLFTYAFMLYFDFSGYSDMAIGLGNACGFHFNENFDHPYVSVSVTDFWRRWHVSLGRWFRDYVYIPLGGNRKGKARTLLNNFLTMVVVGLWHGSTWMFVIWGALHGLGLVVHKLCRPWLRKIPDNGLSKAFGWLLTMAFVTVCWVFFRAGSLQDCQEIFTRIGTTFDLAYVAPFWAARRLWCILLAVSITGLLIPPRLYNRAQARFSRLPWVVIFLIFVVAVQLVVQLRAGDIQPFIYYQF
jgi:alginate O-acetyltransferase complex protein AlgI